MREDKLNKYKEEEYQTPLWIRAKVGRLEDVITNHQNLSLDKYVSQVGNISKGKKWPI
jgi:hypothetical protein